MSVKVLFVLALVVAFISIGLTVAEWRSPTYRYQGAVGMTATEALPLVLKHPGQVSVVSYGEDGGCVVAYDFKSSHQGEFGLTGKLDRTGMWAVLGVFFFVEVVIVVFGLIGRDIDPKV